MPAMSQVLAMATKLQEAEDTISRLQQALEASTLAPATVDIGNKEESPSASTSSSQPLSPEEVQTDLSIDATGQVCGTMRWWKPC